MKFGKYLIDTSVPEWKLAYIDYKSLKQDISNDILQDLFIENLDKELKKINNFYFNQINEFDAKWRFILTTPKKETKRLLRDFYQLNEFLENYQKLNKIGFVKIIKKYDKKNDTYLSNEILDYYLTDNVFNDKTYTEFLDKILIQTIELVGNRKNALHFLGRSSKPKQDEFTFFKSGIYIGLSIMMIALSIIKIVTDGLTSGIWYSIMYIYLGMFIIILSLFGFSIDVYIWRKFRINYIFIFELNWGDTLTWKQFFTFGSFGLLMWSSSLLATVYQVTYFKFFPLFLIVSAFILLVFPLKFFFYSSRMWFLSTLLRIFNPGFTTVLFKDFFIADLMVSLSFFWSSLYVLVCFYINKTQGQCLANQSFITPLLICIPLIIRFFQCIKQWFYSDSKQLYNAIKYLLTMASVFGSSFNAISKYTYVTIIWIIIAVISTIYSYYWDLQYDWSIFRKNKLIPRFWLRFAIILNLFLRFNWILSVNTFLLFDQVLLSFFFSCLEIVRRYTWALFRVELEHTHNIDHYRVINDIPLLNNDNDNDDKV